MVDGITSLDGSVYLVESNTSGDSSSVNAASFDEVYSAVASDEDLDYIFQDVAREYGLNVSFLKAVAQAESGLDKNAVSSGGALGIMQLMPATCESYGVSDPFDARQNITGGAKVLKWLMEEYNGNATLALAAYNAGYGNVNRYGGVPPFNETWNFINKINSLLGGALDGDSSTIEGASATFFGEVEAEQNLDETVKEEQSVVYADEESNQVVLIDGNQYQKEIIDGNQYLVKEQDSVVNELNREQQSGDDELMTEEEYNYFKNAFMQALNSMSSEVIKQDDNSYSEPVLAKNLYDVYSGSYNRFI